MVMASVASSLPFKLERSPLPLGATYPLYVQVAQGLLDWIESGRLGPGAQLPPERQLSDSLGVNRMTLRRALGMLAGQGLLVRKQGRGTYVASPKIERRAGELISFTRVMERRGFRPGARMISFQQRPVEASLAPVLDLPVSAPVYEIQRLRLLNQEPVMIEHYIIPVRRFPGLERFDLESRSMYEVMEREYHVTVVRARQSLEPVLATEYESDLLAVPPGAPLMMERRFSYDAQDQPVEHGRDLYRGDRFRFVTEVAPLER
jgi:GntR family transcriptional regulator